MCISGNPLSKLSVDVFFLFSSLNKGLGTQRGLESMYVFFAWPRSRMTDLKKGLAQVAAKVRRNVYT